MLTIKSVMLANKQCSSKPECMTNIANFTMVNSDERKISICIDEKYIAIDSHVYISIHNVYIYAEHI